MADPPYSIPAFQTAAVLAQYQFTMLEGKEEGDRAMLDRKHFEEVRVMATKFKEYLKNVHRGDEIERRLRRKGRSVTKP